jgi:hypothetical protein
MSYDLAVFEPRAELHTRPAFLTWYRDRTSWKGGRDYSDPANAALALQAWCREMIQTFPPLNGPDRPEDMDLCAADYSIGPDIIYVAFSGGRAADAYGTIFHLASRHGIGFLIQAETERQISGGHALHFGVSGVRIRQPRIGRRAPTG